MLEFEPYSISVLKRAIPYIKKSVSRCSELSAAVLFMWQEGYNMHFCFWNNTLVVREDIGEQPAFTWPMGENVDGMVDMLIEYAKANNLPLRFYEIDDNVLNTIKSDKRLMPSMSAYEERWSDYVYSFEDVLTFAGKKYKGQRNHINKFRRLYGEPNVRFINAQDRSSIEKMLCEYEKEHQEANSLENMEFQMTYKLLDVYEKLDLYAACLTVDGEIAAISIGEIVGDTLLIHIEKALRKYDGIYPTMYQSFVKLIANKIGRNLKFVNREDDAGDAGLRASKLQYQPIERVNKYLVHINSPAAKIKEMPSIAYGGVVLTPFRESDKKAYLALNTDIDNNRYWGYDYREDEEIIGRIDENTFYDFTMLDMKAGDSVNFAVRTAPSGEMIGEAILWNFNSNNEAEIGCRIMPKYQGKGLGKAAFSALADFGEQTLGVNLKARCYIQNTVSYRMITASGFVKSDEDKKFYYFKRPYH